MKTTRLITAILALALISPAAFAEGYVGKMETFKTREYDSLIRIAHDQSLGYVEIRAANPGIDPWSPGRNTDIVLPKLNLLPDAPHEGIVVNLGEMRVYSFVKDKKNPVSYPIGIGKEGFNTPSGTTTIQRKTVGPTWRPTARMRKEDPKLPVVVQSNVPENPLGTHALYLGWPEYLMHGTNKPWSVGRRASSGCMRMYNEDVVKLFNGTPVGTKVTVVRQPVKVGWINDMLYLEASPDGMLADRVEDYGVDGIDYRVPDDLFGRLNAVAGPASEKIDWRLVRNALRDRVGYPVPVLAGAKPDFIAPERPRRNSEPVIVEPTEDTQDRPSPNQGRPSSIRKKLGTYNG